MTVPSFVFESAQAVVDMAAGELGVETLGSIGDPQKVAAAIVEALADIDNIELLNELSNGALASLPPIPSSTYNRSIQQRNQNAIVELVRGLASVRYAEQATRETYTDRDRAFEIRDRAGDVLDALDNTDIDTWRAIRALRAALTDYVSSIVRELPAVIRAQPAAVIPSLALAYDIYGDLSRADDISTRNRLPRPGFVPAAPIEFIR